MNLTHEFRPTNFRLWMTSEQWKTYNELSTSILNCKDVTELPRFTEISAQFIRTLTPDAKASLVAHSLKMKIKLRREELA